MRQSISPFVLPLFQNLYIIHPFIHSPIDPCEPNPCQNGGLCTLSTDGSVECACSSNYLGPFCVVPVQPTCPDDFCDAVYNPFLTVNRLVGGDHVIITQGLSEGYCNAINGYCISENGDDCEACRCEPNLSYMYDTGKCEDESKYITVSFSYHSLGNTIQLCFQSSHHPSIQPSIHPSIHKSIHPSIHPSIHLSINYYTPGCTYKFSQTTQLVPPLYVSFGNLLSVETNTQLPIVHSTTNRPPSNQCNISIVEMNTREGWLSITSSGFDLSEDNGSTYLQVM